MRIRKTKEGSALIEVSLSLALGPGRVGACASRPLLRSGPTDHLKLMALRGADDATAGASHEPRLLALVCVPASERSRVTTGTAEQMSPSCHRGLRTVAPQLSRRRRPSFRRRHRRHSEPAQGVETMTPHRSWIALAFAFVGSLALLLCASLSAGIAHAGGEAHDGLDVERWDGGRWMHGDHLGRVGWWWIVGDGWYFYPSPVYRYPDPYAYVPPDVAGPLSDYSYYCPSQNAYYPSVTECPWGWRRVGPPPAPQS